MRANRKGVWRLVLLIALLASFAAACSTMTDTDQGATTEASDEDEGVASLEDSATDTTEAAVDNEAAAIAFTECMRDNGIEMEDPTVDADGNVVPGRPLDLPEPGDSEDGGGIPDSAAFEEVQAAFEECGELLEGTTFAFTQGDESELQDQLLELAACLRDQGLEVADPDFSTFEDAPDGPSGQGGLFGLDFRDPEVEAALEQCEEFMPNVAGGPGGPGGATPPGSDS